MIELVNSKSVAYALRTVDKFSHTAICVIRSKMNVCTLKVFIFRFCGTIEPHF